MKALHKLTIIGIIVLLISVFSVQIVAASPVNTLYKQQCCEEPEQNCDLSVLDSSPLLASLDISEPSLDLNSLIKSVPKTPEDTESKIPARSDRFILWTHNGINIMWGRYGGGFFVGTANTGTHIWGIYRQHLFVGFYGEQLFWGRYYKGQWIAYNLFSQRVTYGQYKLFPYLQPTDLVAETVP